MDGFATRHLPLNFFAFRGKPKKLYWKCYTKRSLSLQTEGKAINAELGKKHEHKTRSIFTIHSTLCYRVVIALWVIVGFVISRMGWHQFAKKYASVTRPLGRSFHCQIVWFGSIFASYRNAVRIVISDAGIYFYPIILFRAFHPPFLVPWDKVVGVIKRKRFFIVSQELKIRDDAGEIHIGMSESAVLELQRFKNI